MQIQVDIRGKFLTTFVVSFAIDCNSHGRMICNLCNLSISSSEFDGSQSSSVLLKESPQHFVLGWVAVASVSNHVECSVRITEHMTTRAIERF